MKQFAHPIFGGIAALTAAALLAFGTDSSTRPTSWAVPATTTILVLACIGWIATRAKGETARHMVSPDAALQAADRATFEDLVQLVPRNVIDFPKRT